MCEGLESSRKDPWSVWTGTERAGKYHGQEKLWGGGGHDGCSRDADASLSFRRPKILREPIPGATRGACACVRAPKHAPMHTCRTQIRGSAQQHRRVSWVRSPALQTQPANAALHSHGEPLGAGGRQ